MFGTTIETSVTPLWQSNLMNCQTTINTAAETSTTTPAAATLSATLITATATSTTTTKPQ